MSGLHNEKVVLWNGFGCFVLFLAQKLFSNTLQHFHPQQNVNPEMPIHVVSHKNSQQLPRTLYWVLKTSLPRNSSSVSNTSEQVGRVPVKLFNSLENSLHMTHFRYPQVQAVNLFSVLEPFPF